MVGKRQNSQKSCKPCFVHYPEQCQHMTVVLAGTGDPDSSKPGAAVCEVPLDNQEHHKEFISFLSYSSACEKVPNFSHQGFFSNTSFHGNGYLTFSIWYPITLCIYRCSIFRNGFFFKHFREKTWRYMPIVGLNTVIAFHAYLNVNFAWNI